MSQEASSGRNGGGSGGGSASFLPYLCYGCRRGVLITPSRSPPSEILCPICHGESLQNINRQSVSPTVSPSRVPIKICIDLELGLDQTRSDSNPCAFLQIYTDIMADISDIQLVFQNNSGEGGFQLPSNLDDFFIEHDFENVPNWNGTPPASRSSVEALPEIKITAELLVSKSSECAVCKEDFTLDETVKQMVPCTHIFHSACLLTWLGQHNSCPMCRHELPTHDPDHENRTSTNPQTTTWYRPRTWVHETRNIGTTSGSRVIGEDSGETIDENVVTSFRLPWQAWSRAQPAMTCNNGEQNNAGYRIVNEGSASVLSVTIVISRVTGGTSNENPYIPSGFKLRLIIPRSAWSRAQHEERGNNGAGNNALD